MEEQSSKEVIIKRSSELEYVCDAIIENYPINGFDFIDFEDCLQKFSKEMEKGLVTLKWALALSNDFKQGKNVYISKKDGAWVYIAGKLKTEQTREDFLIELTAQLLRKNKDQWGKRFFK